MKKNSGYLIALTITVIVVTFFSGFARAAQVTKIVEGHRRIHINGGVDDGFVVGATVCFSTHTSEGHTCGTVVSAEASSAVVKVPSKKAANRMRRGTEALLIVEKEEKEDKKDKAEIKETKENKDKEKEDKKVKKEDWFK